MEGTHGQQSPGKEDLRSEKGKSGCGGKRSPPVSSGDLQSVTGDGKDYPKDPLSSGLRNSVMSLCWEVVAGGDRCYSLRNSRR